MFYLIGFQVVGYINADDFYFFPLYFSYKLHLKKMK